jgi:hypothetical protein
MKPVKFSRNNGTSPGVLVGDGVVDVRSAWQGSNKLS